MLRHVLICVVVFLCLGNVFGEHVHRELLDSQTTALVGRSDLTQFKNDLKEILKVRVPGTPGHDQVRRFIIGTMEDLGWSIDATPFEAKVPYPFGRNGKMVFTNVIATLDPRAKKRLILACHYDSKYMVDPRNKRKKFLGAIDSAVPCTMLINIARAMEKELRAYRNPDLTLQFIFFDGEEAFVEWSSTDSIYGAKHLAKKWQKEPWHLDGTTARLNQLDRIDLFVLLDLLGTPGVTIPSYYRNTGKWHDRLEKIETRLFNSNLLTRHRSRIFGGNPYGFIEDDHTPFLKRGVQVLHVIPSPFPHVWHEFSDNEKALDYDTIENLNKIFRHFVAEYLHL